MVLQIFVAFLVLLSGVFLLESSASSSSHSSSYLSSTFTSGKHMVGGLGTGSASAMSKHQRQRKRERKRQFTNQKQHRRAQTLPDLPGNCEMFFLLEYDVVTNIDSKDIRRVYAKDAYVQVAQMGRSEGRPSIEETVSFFSSQSPFMEEVTYYSTIPIFSGFRRNGLCEFFFMYAARFHLASEFTKEQQGVENDDEVYVEAPIASKVFYDPEDNLIRHVHFLLESSFLRFLFRSIDSDDTTKFVCDTLLRSRCSEAAQVSNVDDGRRKKCRQKLADLPLSDNKSKTEFLVDGDSRSCRIYQTPFAAHTEDQCPHISLKPLEDENGQVKCQQSQNLSATQLFTRQELQSWKDFQRVSLGNLSSQGGFRFYGTSRRVCEFGKATNDKGKCRSSCKRKDGVRFDSKTLLCKPLSSNAET